MENKITSIRIKEDLKNDFLMLKIKNKLDSVEDVLQILYDNRDEDKFQSVGNTIRAIKDNDGKMERKELIRALVEEHNFDVTLITDDISNKNLKHAIKEAKKKESEVSELEKLK